MTFLAMLAEQVSGVGAVLLYVAVFLTVLTIVVFVHELGHFLVARWCGVAVSVFSIGFGREIYGFDDRHGTRWKFSWIPLGGYVKFMDDDDPASAMASIPADQMTAEQRSGSFHLKPIWQRAAVVAAGPIANFILAIVLFAGLFMFMGVRETAPKVDEVVAGLPADLAGIRSGDVIRSIDGSTVNSFVDVQRVVATSIGQSLDVVLDRNGERVEVVLVPIAQSQDDGVGGKMTRGVIGIKRTATPESYKVSQPGPIEAIGLGVKETGFLITATLGYIRDVFVGRQDASQIGGLPHMAEATRRIVDLSPEMLPGLVAMISVSIGLINLFPIPVLDGGHLMFYAIEAVRRRPLSPRTQEYAFRAGMTVILMLMVFSNLYNGRHILMNWFGLSG